MRQSALRPIIPLGLSLLLLPTVTFKDGLELHGVGEMRILPPGNAKHWPDLYLCRGVEGLCQASHR